jgi:signal transduction histidine kinase
LFGSREELVMTAHPISTSPGSFCSENGTASSATSATDHIFLEDDSPLALREHLRRWCENLSTAAHDLKTPLSILGGYIDLLLEEKLGALNGRQREILSDMKQNEARLQRFIRDFITFREFQGTPGEPNCGVHDLNECVADIASVWSARFCEKQVRLCVVNDPNVAPFAFHYYKVQHVVSNLLDNALKFSPRGSDARIETSACSWERRGRCPRTADIAKDRRRAVSAAPNSARVIVKDAGPGIAPQFHQDIFRDFYRLESQGRPHGTGLGLAIARRLVRLHGGAIWVESEPNRGCTFMFLLPFKPPVEKSDAKE